MAGLSVQDMGSNMIPETDGGSNGGSMSNSSFGSGFNGDGKVKRKRNRIPLSCTICRKRKVKCDKTRPHCNQCTKTGVAHLCHYMEQSWAEEAEKELSKDMELKNLKERVRYLERSLSKVHASTSNSTSNTPDNAGIGSVGAPSPATNTTLHTPIDDKRSSNMMSTSSLVNDDTGADENTGVVLLSGEDKYEEDELDLTKQFDMLHIKNNGTIHLGATHWLAIMKGDPYLKLLWGHIFQIREKVNEWYSQRLLLQKYNRKKRHHHTANGPSRCPVVHVPIEGAESKPTLKEPVPYARRAAINQYLPPLPAGDINKCPVVGHMVLPANKEPGSPLYKVEPENIPAPAPHPLPPSSGDAVRRCPVTGQVADDSIKSSPAPPAALNSDETNSKTSIKISPQAANAKVRNVEKLPSFKKLTNAKFGTGADQKNLISEYNRKLELDALSNEEIIEKVTKLLPPRPIIFQFINKFFKHIYPIIPVIDEQNFKNHVEEILSCKMENAENTSTAPLSLKVSKGSDYCYLGIMAIILRLTWLSLPGNRCEMDLGAFDGNSGSAFNANSPASPASVSSITSTSSSANIKEDTLLLNYETPAEALELIKDYLIKFDKISSISNNNINLTTIQFAVFYKIYMSNSPTEGFVNPKVTIHSISDSNAHDNESNQILLSSIIQMAFSCGLHRDPDNFPQLNVVSTYHNNSANGTALDGNNSAQNAEMKNTSESKMKENQVTTERFKHTWRKIWYYIVHLDVQQSLALGSPRLLRNLKDFSDTKLPSSSKIDYVRDIKELIIIKNYTLFWQIDLVIIAILNHILNVNVAKNVRKCELDALIDSLKQLTYGNESINDVLKNLVNKGLLSTSEGPVSYQDYSDETYGLPSLEEILSREAVTAPPSMNNTPMSTTVHDIHTPNGSSSQNHHSSSDKRFELPHEATTKALFFTKHLTLRMLLYLLNYILFTHYEPKGSTDSGTIGLTKHYAQEALTYALDGYRNCLIFFSNVRKSPNNMSTIFDYVNVLLSPGCLDIGHRALQFLVCLTLRAKCGPIGNMNQNLFTAGGEDSDNDTISNPDSNNATNPVLAQGNLADLNPNIINDINLESVTDAQLSDNLVARMELFQQLTSQIAVKFPYANRTSRSTGFFITLLGGKVSKKDGDGSVGVMKHPKISGFFKNVPSLVLSGDNDQLSRCPVFQDALGFMSPRTPSTPQATQLPPFKSSYKPITYTNSNIRKMELKKEQQDEKRRKLNVPSPLTNPNVMTGSNNSNIIPPLPIINSVNNFTDNMSAPNGFYDGNMNVPMPQYRANDALRSGAPRVNGPPSAGIGSATVTPMRVPTPLSMPLPPIEPSSGVSNMVDANGNPVVPPFMNNTAAGGLNSLNVGTGAGNHNGGGLNELFDPTNVMQAITQFNPLLEMNNFAGGLMNMSDFGGNDSYTNSSAPSSNVNSNASRTPSMMPGQDTNYNGAPNADLDFFIPKIEDGFTELQDFTIWD
ncbi:Hap1p KNAG_0I01450 [Huiozyma naganishii CBS 8797]|uniref:Zn(2)-C6 fungal-type domain-containing protein n=1 Tax=Huiozyma naganishii (strain ATCC MYA-139 / BCRC 22969 / CBS 8797 / KCTC 17520 / NBRC 10181 / NCYC 3082 / Yp74L-3) TaxID=1071383 RepID=J7S960_HUIN7|nr:hypothetical protein KNAG_0I01450 [Kazachstania naganishii CBS 8797]CCK71934.1 hypothetical protein KNAG_0I01450 [Kazachstania naganishii CBS 8797]